MKNMIAIFTLVAGVSAFAGAADTVAPKGVPDIYTKHDTASHEILGTYKYDTAAGTRRGIDSVLAKYGRNDSIQASKLAAEASALKAMASRDSAKLAALKASLPTKPDTNWAAHMPDSVKVVLDQNRARIEHFRDSLQTVLKANAEALKAKIDTLKIDAKIRRDVFLSQLNEADRTKVQTKIEALDKRNEARRAAIEKAIAEAKARMEAQKAAK
jgi:hypothetical protein